MSQPERRAFYLFEAGAAEMVIHLPLDEEGPFDANEIASWVGLLVDRVRPWAEPFRLAGVTGLRLEAGPGMDWRPTAATPRSEGDGVQAGTGLQAFGPGTPRSEGDGVGTDNGGPDFELADPERPNAWTPDRLIEQQNEQVYQLLLAAGRELRPMEILPLLEQLSPPLHLAKERLLNRLRQMAEAGRLTRRHCPDQFGRPTYYAAIPPSAPEPPLHRTPRSPEAPNGSGPAPVDMEAVREAAAVGALIPQRVLDWTEGKVMLFWGGKPPGAETRARRIQLLQRALRLKEVRWPEYEAKTGYPAKLRELKRGDVDFMVVNQFNRHHVSHELNQAARERGIPVIWLGRTSNLAQLVAELDLQIAQHGLGVPTLRVAA